VTGAALMVFSTLEALPPSAQALLDRAGADNLFASRLWFETFVASGMAGGSQPLFFLLTGKSGDALALLPCQRQTRGDTTVSSLTSFYSCDFRPLIAPGADGEKIAFDLGRALAAHLAGEAQARFDSLDSTAPLLKPFLAGLSIPGRALLRYAHFGRWSQDVAGLAYGDYLAARDGALRETIRRKGARLTRDGASFHMIEHDDDLERGIADYRTVYAESWKEAEPFPDFQPTLMRALARAGWLRLAICRIGDRPVAAQIWSLTAGRASVLKLAHDKAFDGLSPGTVLTAFAIRSLMEKDRISMLDFGRGDDAYKQAWTTRRTQHLGILWTSIYRRPGAVIRHYLGRSARRLYGIGA
jgi:CelD/BcsL family acetyltransferase involved in cellulose biosynthesis